MARTAADEYEVSLGHALVFRARHTGALSSEHVFTPGEWVEEVVRLARSTGQREGGKK